LQEGARAEQIQAARAEVASARGAVAGVQATVEELAAALGGVKRMTIWRQLRKLGYTHKKRPSAMPSVTQR
jgi:transcriptional regulator of acetoin/glycerol metabolism